MIVALLPFIWMLRTALGPPQTAIDQSAALIPSSVTLENFNRAWYDLDLGTAVFNGVLVSGTVLILQLFTSITAGYAFAETVMTSLKIGPPSGWYQYESTSAFVPLGR